MYLLATRVSAAEHAVNLTVFQALHSRLRVYFFTYSSQQFYEEGTYSCFSGQKSEAQRGSVICNNLNAGLCDIKGCALNPAF